MIALVNHKIFKQSFSGMHMNKWLELLLGMILFLAPVVLVLNNLNTWGKATWQFIQGGLVISVLAMGLMFILLGISDISN